MTIDGYALSAIVVAALVVIILAAFLVRTVRRDHNVKVARMGVFIERQRTDALPTPEHPKDRWTPEPLPPDPPPADEAETKEHQIWPRKEDEL